MVFFAHMRNPATREDLAAKRSAWCRLLKSLLPATAESSAVFLSCAKVHRPSFLLTIA
ncbi:hypothetical protein [Nostoc sp. ATCC 53789]|uniref:hypothetical protein n=1 Tax=Nostoc sp. ATCC 53789 TaxID=76335 RepID=UPI00132ECAEB|nr:hypothetical protein [Nostoc sp. ATCC 53789]QHG17865.1 hypothetical protein GJB62_19015 [Nostoc sp. ATCC 53789]